MPGLKTFIRNFIISLAIYTIIAYLSSKISTDLFLRLIFYSVMTSYCFTNIGKKN
ncbi:Uncharacterised protein [Chlamydia trachomatis]|nr:Uncharacterised protein [Chlamydia trachomatis]